MIYRASPGTQFGVRARFCEPHTFRRFRGRAIAFSAAAYDQITRVPHPLCLPDNGNAIVRDSEGCDGAWTRRPFKDVYMYICTCIYPYGNFHTPSKLLLDRRQQIVINIHYLPLEWNGTSSRLNNFSSISCWYRFTRIGNRTRRR